MRNPQYSDITNTLILLSKKTRLMLLNDDPNINLSYLASILVHEQEEYSDFHTNKYSLILTSSISYLSLHSCSFHFHWQKLLSSRRRSEFVRLEPMSRDKRKRPERMKSGLLPRYTDRTRIWTADGNSQTEGRPSWKYDKKLRLRDFINTNKWRYDRYSFS